MSLIKCRASIESKRFIKACAFVLAFVFLTAAVQDEMVEIEGWLNGRSSARFYRSDHNVRFTLKKGTKGKILERKKFNSGNSGIQIEVLNGPHKNEVVWVHYHPKGPDDPTDPNLKFLKGGEEVSDPTNAEQLQARKSLNAISDPEYRASERAKDEEAYRAMFNKMHEGQEALDQVNGRGAGSRPVHCHRAHALVREREEPSEQTPRAPTNYESIPRHLVQASTSSGTAVEQVVKHALSACNDRFGEHLASQDKEMLYELAWNACNNFIPSPLAARAPVTVDLSQYDAKRGRILLLFQSCYMATTNQGANVGAAIQPSDVESYINCIQTKIPARF